MGEILKKIKDYPEYEVSSHGRIKSYKKCNSGKIMSNSNLTKAYRVLFEVMPW